MKAQPVQSQEPSVLLQNRWPPARRQSFKETCEILFRCANIRRQQAKWKIRVVYSEQHFIECSIHVKTAISNLVQRCEDGLQLDERCGPFGIISRNKALGASKIHGSKRDQQPDIVRPACNRVAELGEVKPQTRRERQ